MSKFKLTQTAAEVQDILNNSLQKPTGLAKTKLVGVGVNGQENIEIGDNLTLANGKLSSAAAGGGINGLESDAEGNLTASKDLGVDGKLKLKSLVSASNPDGDITKELGGKTLYAHYIRLRSGNANLVLNYISSKAEKYTVATLKADLTTTLKKIVCNGFYDSKLTQYITADGAFFVVVTLEDGGAINRYYTNFNSIDDYVEAI